MAAHARETLERRDLQRWAAKLGDLSWLWSHSTTYSGSRRISNARGPARRLHPLRTLPGPSFLLSFGFLASWSSGLQGSLSSGGLQGRNNALQEVLARRGSQAAVEFHAICMALKGPPPFQKNHASSDFRFRRQSQTFDSSAAWCGIDFSSIGAWSCIVRHDRGNRLWRAPSYDGTHAAIS